MDRLDSPAQDTQSNNLSLDKMFTLKKIQIRYQKLRRANLRDLLCEESSINDLIQYFIFFIFFF